MNRPTAKEFLEMLEVIEKAGSDAGSTRQFGMQLPRWRLHRDVTKLPAATRERMLTAGALLIAGAMGLPIENVEPALVRATRLINHHAPKGRAT